MYASDIQSPRGQPVSVLTDHDHPFAHLQHTRTGRSSSLSHDHELGALGVQDRLKLTFDQRKGWKANTRGAFIQDTLITLEELLADLPEEISLNAELSEHPNPIPLICAGLTVDLEYPRLHDIALTNLAPMAIEVNIFVDAILEKILRFGGKRRIVLSSFSPEVCVAMRLKQSKYPVMLISNAGKPPPPVYVPVADLDRRTASLHSAVAFARRWRLSGICTTCETYLLAPRMVGYVKKNGLKCASYGLNNNTPENAMVGVARA